MEIRLVQQWTLIKWMFSINKDKTTAVNKETNPK